MSDRSWRSIDIDLDRRFISFYANDWNRRNSKVWIAPCAAAARNKTLDIFTNRRSAKTFAAKLTDKRIALQRTFYPKLLILAVSRTAARNKTPDIFTKRRNAKTFAAKLIDKRLALQRNFGSKIGFFAHF